MSQNSYYRILSNKEVSEIYKKNYQFFYNQVMTFLKTQNTNSIHINEKYIKLVTKLLYLREKYNLKTDKNYLNTISNFSTTYIQDQINTLQNWINNQLAPIKELETIGLQRRIDRNLLMPTLFQNQDRIFIEINPLYSFYKILKKINVFFNSFLPETEQIKLKNQENKTLFQIKNQSVRPIHFLLSLIEEVNILTDFFNKHPSLQNNFSKKIKQLKTNEKNELKKIFPKIKMHNVLFWYLKHAIELGNKTPILALKDFETYIQNFQKQLQEIAIHSQTISKEENLIDTIILSISPRDISTMSTFTDWDTCMSLGSTFYQEIAKQIGAGCVIAYGINKKNPEKKLARILLKPYLSKKSYHYVQELSKIKPIASLNNKRSYNFLDYESDLFINDEPELSIDINEKIFPERIYLSGKVYGLQQSKFKEIVTQIAQNELNTPNVFGLLHIADNMYLDGMPAIHYEYDKNNIDNLKMYLEANFKNEIKYLDNNVIYIPTLNLKNTPHICLRNIKSNFTSILGKTLKNKHIENVETSSLEVHNMGAVQLNEFPSKINVTNSLTFIDTQKSFILPNNIKTKKLILKGFGALSIPQSTQVEELIASRTTISNLPENLSLKVLNLSYCNNIQNLPKTLNVTDKLDLTGINISTLPPMNVDELILSETKNIKKISNNIFFKSLYANNSNLEELPVNAQAESIEIINSKINKIPSKLKAQKVVLENNPLQMIDENINISSLNIANTPISFLPENLTFDELILTRCKNIHSLPQTLTITKMLNISQTEIETLPPLNLKQLFAVDAKKLKKIPSHVKFNELIAHESGLTKLPKNLKTSVLQIDKTKISSLPEGLIADVVSIKNSDTFKKIHPSVKIKKLLISNTNIQNLPENMNFEYLDISYCKRLKKLPQKIDVMDTLNLNDSGIQELPNLKTKTIHAQNCLSLQGITNFIQCDEINLANSGISKISHHLNAKRINASSSRLMYLNDINCENLNISSNPIKHLPENLSCNTLDISNTKICEIPANINVKSIKAFCCDLKTIHYSDKINQIFLFNPDKNLQIHPDFPIDVFAGMSISDINEAKKNYIKNHPEYQHRACPQKISTYSKLNHQDKDHVHDE